MSQLKTKKQARCRLRRRKEQRPAEILTATLQLFSIRGFATTRLEEAANTACVFKGTLYLYFKNKEALSKDVVGECVLPQIVKAEEQVEDYPGPMKGLLLTLAENWRCIVLETGMPGISKIIMSEA